MLILTHNAVYNKLQTFLCVYSRNRQSGWRARIQKKRMIKKPVKTKKSKMEPKVKNQEKIPKLKHGKMKKKSLMKETLIIKILGLL